ncbi:39S ribosomal protein L27, mitochondrial [Orussus abietinus]|uniref:39S ribosomal protein L27, mitochondrial n=1 Tax=Orussus abietinus TaxID=222816 RepID=UPI0006253F8E|nr:39S ribosomal protein L27, mitochondrial [Orussus abietinus]
MSLGSLLFNPLKYSKNLLLTGVSSNVASIRFASKKSATNTRNPPKHGRPKHRGYKVPDGVRVPEGKILATQRTTRFHPGYNVSFGINGTLCALQPGKVYVTCEKVDLNWDHDWVQRNYAGHNGKIIYKKHFHVIPERQHCCFKLVEAI